MSDGNPYKKIPLPEFNVDGLPYDSAFLIDRQLAFPIAFTGDVNETILSGGYSEFTSARGVRREFARGGIVRQWAINYDVPWSWGALAAQMYREQTQPLYFISPIARRTNFLAPFSEFKDAFVGNVGTVGKNTIEDSKEVASSAIWAGNGFPVRVFNTYDMKEDQVIYSPPSGIIAGSTISFNVWLNGTPGARAYLVGTNYNGDIVWSSPTVTIPSSRNGGLYEYKARGIEVPKDKGIWYIREAYAGKLNGFAPMQAWFGTDEPAMSPRMGGWGIMHDFSYRAKSVPSLGMVSMSFTIKETSRDF